MAVVVVADHVVSRGGEDASPSQGCTSCLEYWTVASCLQSIVIAIYVLTVQAEGSTATRGKLFPSEEPEYKRLSGNLRAFLRP